MNYISTIAEVLLESKHNLYLESRSLLFNKPDEYMEKELDDKYDYSPEEMDEGAVEETFFTGFAQTENFTTMIDWSGEYDPGQLEEWVNKRMNMLGLPAEDFLFIKEWEENLQIDSLGRGDYIVEKFSLMGKYLEKNALKLVFYVDGSDAYYPFIVSLTDFEKLPKQGRCSDDDEDYELSICGWDEMK